LKTLNLPLPKPHCQLTLAVWREAAAEHAASRAMPGHPVAVSFCAAVAAVPEPGTLTLSIARLAAGFGVCRGEEELGIVNLTTNI